MPVETSRLTADRRTVLGFTVALAPGLVCGAAVAAPDDPAPPPRDAAGGYRETEHVLTAYARMRF